MYICVFSRSVIPDSLWFHGLQPTRLLCWWGFSRQEYWSGLPCPPPGDLSSPGIEPRSPTLQADSLLPEPPGKPKNTRVGSLSLLHGIFPTQELNQGSPGGFFTSCTTREALVYMCVCDYVIVKLSIFCIVLSQIFIIKIPIKCHQIGKHEALLSDLISLLLSSHTSCLLAPKVLHISLCQRIFVCGISGKFPTLISIFLFT